MLKLSRHIHSCVLCLLILIPSQSAFSQTKGPGERSAAFEKLETQIANKQEFRQTAEQLERLKSGAAADGDDVSHARSLYDLLRIRDLQTEDSLYFQNSAFMDTVIENSRLSTRFKAMIHLMRAQRIRDFDQRFLNFNTGAYRSKSLKVDYAALSASQRAEIVYSDFAAALAHKTAAVPISQLSWLPFDRELLAFDADLVDLVRAERISWLRGRFNEDQTTKTQAQSMLQLSSAQFRAKLASLTKNADPLRPTTLAAFQEWVKANNARPATAALIEALTRNHIFGYGTPDALQQKSYIAYLEKSMQSEYPDLKAYAIYQLCSRWNSEGNEFQYAKKHQFQRKRSLDLYERHAQFLKQYPVYAQPLEDMARQIRSSGIQIELEDKQLPGRPLPLMATYRNSDRIYYRIIRVNGSERFDKPGNEVDVAWLAQPAVNEGHFALSLPEDHQVHTAALHLPQLPIGSYRLLFQNKPLADAGEKFSFHSFQVTSIAAIHSDSKVFVLNRGTGLPLSGAAVRVLQKLPGISASKLLRVAKDGHVDVPAGTDSLLITNQGDTMLYQFARPSFLPPSTIFKPSDNEDLEGYYLKHLRMEVFTDRSIYRPGQKVQFKALFFTRQQETGSAILLNKASLGAAMIKRLQAAQTEKGRKHIILANAFGKQLDSLPVEINDFASFAGSFVLPKNAATGEWNIGNGAPNYGNNPGNFKVEAYKRPGIELEMAGQKKLLRPGQAFKVTLKVRSFSGATLNNIPVSYSLIRSGYPAFRLPEGQLYDYESSRKKLADTTLLTDEKGELVIPVLDSDLSGSVYADEQWNFRYWIVAKAVDATGESTDFSGELNVSARPVDININVAQIYDRQQLPALALSTSNRFEGAIMRNVRAQLFRLGAVESDTSHKVMVLDTIIHTTAGAKLSLPASKLRMGYHQLLLSGTENGDTLGASSAKFYVFDSKSGEIPGYDLDYIAADAAKPGDLLTWYGAGKKDNYTIYQVLYFEEGSKHKRSTIYQTRMEQAGLRRWTFKVPDNIRGLLFLRRITVFDNQIRTQERRIYIEPKKLPEVPEIVIEKYRRTTTPGARETIKISVKTKDEHVAAELMTSIYDATLEKLNTHRWTIPSTTDIPFYPASSWNYSLSGGQRKGDRNADQGWVYIPRFIQPVKAGLLAGRISGMALEKKVVMNEVVVGYGDSDKTIKLRGRTSLVGDRQPLIIVDGEVFTGDLNSLDQSLIEDLVVLKDAEAVAQYGSRAMQGVLVIRTKAGLDLQGSGKPLIKIRKDFSETAFFQPQMHADRDGYFTFSFTMPESATTWNWKMLAHTAKGSFAYLERKLQTQLRLMVQANMTRFLYQGDRINLQSRISNLDTLAIKGDVKLRIEDAVTGEDLTRQITDLSNIPFNMAGNSSGALAYTLRIPESQTNPLKLIITAQSGESADAEEHLLPILSKRVFVRQRLPLAFGTETSLTLKPPALPKDASLLGMSVSVDQKPAAAVLYALPWLANNHNDGAQQIFDRLRAQVTAIETLKSDTLLQAAVLKAKSALLNEDVATNQLPDEISNTLTPWLGLNNYAAKQQTQLLDLLDSTNASQQKARLLGRLYKLQQADGGLSWFEGGRSNAEITAYVLAGFGKLQSLPGAMNLANDAELNEFFRKLVENQQRSLQPRPEIALSLFQAYACAYWLKTFPLSSNQLAAVDQLLNKEWAQVKKMNLAQQALLVISTFKYCAPGDVRLEKAQQQLAYIRQLAIEDGQHGLRWKEIADAEDLNRSAEETMALLADAFEESGRFKEVQPGLVKWLLATKQDEHWQTTTGTSAAIELLQRENAGWSGETSIITTNIDGKLLSVSDGLLQGTPMDYASLAALPQSVQVKSSGRNVSGDLTWYYFASPTQLEERNNGLKIEKTLYVFEKDRNWVPVTKASLLKAGDRVQVRLTVEAGRSLKFVHISDPRAAAFEPKDVSSGQKYAERLSYHQSVKDTGLDIFAEALPRGTSTFTYEMVVAQGGTFNSGPASVQSMYKPALVAYSLPMVIEAK